MPYATYDGNGNATKYPNLSSITWNAENEPTAFGTALTAQYMDNGLRSYAGVGSTGTYFLYDGDEPVCEMNSSGTVTALNTFGNGLLSRWNSSTSSSTFYTFDPHGNVAQRLNSGESVTSTDEYSAFGVREGIGTQRDPWGFGAQEGYYTDTSTGEIYLIGRYYDPGTGRFLSRDPMSYGGGINLYGYCGNGPVDNADPSGMDGGPNQSLLDYYASGDWGEDTLAVFRGYGQALNSSFNPVAIVNGVGALYQYGRQHGVYAAACMAGNGLYHGFTDWTSTIDPTTFGNSFGNVLIAVAAKAAPKVSCIIKCFVAGTPVQMADGSTKPIEQVKIGDKVISRDPSSCKTESRAVIGTKIHPATDILKISFADQTGKIVDVIRCTPEHPFYVDG